MLAPSRWYNPAIAPMPLGMPLGCTRAELPTELPRAAVAVAGAASAGGAELAVAGAPLLAGGAGAGGAGARALGAGEGGVEQGARAGGTGAGEGGVERGAGAGCTGSRLVPCMLRESSWSFCSNPGYLSKVPSTQCTHAPNMHNRIHEYAQPDLHHRKRPGYSGSAQKPEPCAPRSAKLPLEPILPTPNLALNPGTDSVSRPVPKHHHRTSPRCPPHNIRKHRICIILHPLRVSPPSRSSTPRLAPWQGTASGPAHSYPCPSHAENVGRDDGQSSRRPLVWHVRDPRRRRLC